MCNDRVCSPFFSVAGAQGDGGFSRRSERDTARWASGGIGVTEDCTPAPRATPGLDRIRSEARSRVELTSLAYVARRVGMEPSSLKRFLEGGPVRSRSRSKLFHWLVDTALEADDEAANAVQMLRALLLNLPPEEQPPGFADLTGALTDIYSRRAPRMPLWITRLGSAVAAIDDDRVDGEISLAG